MLPRGTPEVIVTSSDNCPSTLTLCKLPKRNPFTHTATLKSTPVAMIFVSSLSCRTKLKAFEKYIIIASVLTPSSSESAISWQTVTSWPAWVPWSKLLSDTSQCCLYCASLLRYCLQVGLTLYTYLHSQAFTVWLNSDVLQCNCNHHQGRQRHRPKTLLLEAVLFCLAHITIFCMFPSTQSCLCHTVHIYTAMVGCTIGSGGAIQGCIHLH